MMATGRIHERMPPGTIPEPWPVNFTPLFGELLHESGSSTRSVWKARTFPEAPTMLALDVRGGDGKFLHFALQKRGLEVAVGDFGGAAPAHEQELDEQEACHDEEYGELLFLLWIKLHFAPCSRVVIELAALCFGSVRQVDML